jgi:hypothetical protein
MEDPKSATGGGITMETLHNLDEKTIFMNEKIIDLVMRLLLFD